MLVGMSPDYLTRWCREGLVKAPHRRHLVRKPAIAPATYRRNARRKKQLGAQLAQRLREARARARVDLSIYDLKNRTGDFSQCQGRAVREIS